MGFRRFLTGIPLGPCMWIAAGWHLCAWCQRVAAELDAEIERNR